MDDNIMSLTSPVVIRTSSDPPWSPPTSDRRRRRSPTVAHELPREKKRRTPHATRARRRARLRSVALNQPMAEGLESRTLLAFTPLPTAQLVVAESAFGITPFSTIVAKFQGNPGDFYLGTID